MFFLSSYIGVCNVIIVEQVLSIDFLALATNELLH